jgi:hypothetical protein
LGKLWTWIRSIFVQSVRVHARQNPAENTQNLISLFDRFLKRQPRYDLEWDDFISWRNDNPHVEQIRKK